MVNKKKKVLVAEDERPLARALSLKLTNAGFDVEVVHDGASVREHVLSDTFDLVLMDLMMPKHDGFAIMEAAKKQGTKAPIVVISNLGQESDIDRATKSGASKYFIKSETPLADIVSYVKESIT